MAELAKILAAIASADIRAQHIDLSIDRSRSLPVKHDY
jgi:hypothetical protein